jgi:hypothetical protein
MRNAASMLHAGSLDAVSSLEVIAGWEIQQRKRWARPHTFAGTDYENQ